MPIESSCTDFHLSRSSTLCTIGPCCLNFFIGRNASTFASNLRQKLPHDIRNRSLHFCLFPWQLACRNPSRYRRSCLDIFAPKSWCEAYLPCRFDATHYCQSFRGSSSCSLVWNIPSRTKICSNNLFAKSNLKLVFWIVNITSW